jgi:threonine dehydrogenase-like Zn-dependent dehydrogenase
MKGTMKAARLHEINGPIVVDEIPIPDIGVNDVLIKVYVTVPNGGDVHVIKGDIPPGKLPMVINHVAAGMVEEVGSEVKSVKRGDRVAVDPTISCMDPNCSFCQSGHNYYCPFTGFPGMLTMDFRTARGTKLLEPYLDGGMAEYWKMPAANCIKVPDSLTWDEVAAVHNAGITYTALIKSGIQPGDNVVLNAATGTTGAAAVKVAQLWNPRRLIVIGRSEKRLKLVKSWGPNIVHTISSVEENVHDRIMELTNGLGADRLIDFSPAGMDIVSQCLRSLRNCSTVVFVGACRELFQIPYNLFLSSGITITGVLAYPRNELAELFSIVSDGKLDLKDFITHRFPLSKANEAYETFIKKTGDPIGIIVLPQE